jgi:hypothetical protein
LNPAGRPPSRRPCAYDTFCEREPASEKARRDRAEDRGVSLEFDQQVAEPIAADSYIELSRVSRQCGPGTDHLRRDLEMELDPIGVRAPTECLVRIGQ